MTTTRCAAGRNGSLREQGYTCDGAGDANTAREQLRQDSYQLALLDVNMPGESGIELLSHIRRDHPEVAVLMVTGEDSAELAMTAIEQGAYGYLVKPVGLGGAADQRGQRAAPPARRAARTTRLMARLQATADERGQRSRRRCRTSSCPRPRCGYRRLKRSSGSLAWSSSATRRPGTTCSA